MDILIRNEENRDFREVEELTRLAFWNLYVPGCDEHYLAHILRSHNDFIPELDYVAVFNDKIVGNIMYTKSRLVNDEGVSIDTLTFGPVSVLPELQRKGIGSKLIRYTIEKAISLNYKAIVINGHPYNYCKHGFVGSKTLRVSDSDGKYPYSLLVLELEKECLKNGIWKYYPSDVYFNLSEQDVAKFDATFEKLEKGYKHTQEEFNIASNAFIE